MSKQDDPHYCDGEGAYFPLSQFTPRDGPYIHNVVNPHYDNGLPYNDSSVPKMPYLPQVLAAGHEPSDE